MIGGGRGRADKLLRTVRPLHQRRHFQILQPVIGAVWIVIGRFVVSIVEADAAVGEFGERRVELGPLDAVAVDVQAGEESEVEAAAGVVVGPDVEPVAVFEQAEGDLEPFLDKGVVDAGEFDQSFGVALFGGEGVLAAFKVGDGDGAGEVGVNELLASSLDPLQPPSLGEKQPLVGGSLVGELLVDRGAREGDDERCEPDAAPVLEDVFLDRLGRQVWEVAIRPLLVAAEAEEVGIEPAGFAAGGAVTEAGVAAGAEEAAFEVVLVPPRAVTRQAAAG